VPERLAVLVAEFVNCGESVADAHTLRLGVPLTLGEGVCDLDRVPDTVPERLTAELTLTVPDTDGQPLAEAEVVPVTARVFVGEEVGVTFAENVGGAPVEDTQAEVVVLRVSVCVGVPLRDTTAVAVTEAEPLLDTEMVTVLQVLADWESVIDPDTEPDADTEPVPEIEGEMERVAEREADPVFVIKGDEDGVSEVQPVTDIEREGETEKESDTVAHPVEEAVIVAEGVNTAEPLKVGLGVPEKVSPEEAVEEGVADEAPVKDEDTEGLCVWDVDLV